MKWLEQRFIPIVRMGLVVGSILVCYMVWLAWCMGSSRLVMLSATGLVFMLPADIVMIFAPDDLRSRATERTLRMASTTLDKMVSGLTPESCLSVCQVLLPETSAVALAMTDTEKVLAYVGQNSSLYPEGSPIKTCATKQVLESGSMKTFTAITSDEYSDYAGDQKGDAKFIPAGIVVPLVVKDEVVGTIKFYYKRARDIDRTQLAIAWGFGQVLSMELSAHELDRQAELVARAEVKALQAQINPHFLFNTLNTIAALTRTEPLQARDLLREFAVFYRQTLENSESRIPISKELEQTHRYLKFEHARFGEDRIVETQHIESGCQQVLVPSFLIQPIVENAVRHGMRDEGPLHIDIHVATEGSDVLIAVADDGLGMDDKVADLLLQKATGPNKNSKGTGIALRNVAERIEKFYGIGSGIEVMSKPNEGTCVTLRLADAAPDHI